MMKKFRAAPVLVAFLAAGSLVAGCGGGDDSSGDSAWDGKTIKIGSIFSTTGDGASFGPQQVKGARLAIKEINGDGGVKGAELGLTQVDDKADPAKSAAAMKKLVKADEVLAVLGPTFSNSAAEADPVANSAKTPVLAVSNTGPGIVGDCPYPCEYVFRDSLGEATAIPANIGQYVSDSNPRSVEIVYPRGDAFGQSSAAVAKAAFRSAGVSRIKIRKAGPEGIPSETDIPADGIMITASSGETVVQLIEQLRKSGFGGKILGGNAFNSTTASASLGEAGTGAQSAAAWYSGNDSDENQAFISAYSDEYGAPPDQFAAQAYTGVKLLAAALEEAGLDLTGEALAADRTALKTALEGVEKETPLGDFKFTADHDVNQPIWIVQMDGKGGFDLVKQLPPK